MGFLVGLLIVCSPSVVVRSVLFIDKDDLSVTTQLYPEIFFPNPTFNSPASL